MEQRLVLSPGQSGRGVEAAFGLSRDFIHERIRAHKPGQRRSPSLANQTVHRGDADLNPGMHLPKSPRPAAVLVGLVEHDDGFTVLLTRRTDHLNNHAGQVSFPGGRLETGETPEEAALRETHEEIGLEPSRVELIGRLDDYVTGTGFCVAPLVGFVRPPFDLSPDPFEVAEVFEVPLAFLLDPVNHQLCEKDAHGNLRRYFAIPYGRHYIWGATAGMLMNLHEILK